MHTLARYSALLTFTALSALAWHSTRAASFDCAKAGSSNEKMICADAQLSALDDRLGALFRQARASALDKRALRADADQHWRWREQHCRDRSCLLAWYQRRSIELQAQANAASASDPAPALAHRAPKDAALAVNRPEAAVLTQSPQSPLQLGLNASQLAAIAPPGASPWPHYVRVEHGQYFYEDPQTPERQLVGVRYYGMEHGQYILEAVRGQTVLRYTCSDDCSYIGQLSLPGDVEKDTVIVSNDRHSLPALIVSDAMNGLLAPSMTR
ncbi:lysozyme inhibitor LprI family protein [Herbaspirillum seropedicae]|uniref:lysozyme inhibitor LprI family protein n=1 Tax=Herbaspirillum seropedicae TaxID=964 RepID=UPI003D98066C